MKFKHSPGICVHCVKRCDRVTSDHVFPRSWYPDTTPENVEKWQAPACKACNNRLGKIEHRLFIPIAIALNTNDPATSGITAKAIASMDPSRAKSERDRRFRTRLLRDSNKRIRPVGDVPASGTVSLSDTPTRFALPLASKDLDAFVEKIVRGYTFAKHEKYISDPYEVSVFADGPLAIPVERITHRLAIPDQLGPGITVTRAEATDDEHTAIFSIVLYERWPLCAVVLPRGGDDEAVVLNRFEQMC